MKYCHYCGKELGYDKVRDFCRGTLCKRKFFGWNDGKPSELDARVDTGRKVGGLNHVYLKNI
jgi:hypothetical protein